MLRITATWGEKSLIPWSWKLLSSSSRKSYSLSFSATDTSGVPMFPPVKTLRPLRPSISDRRDVVVVFPFVPVMPITGFDRKFHASSISLITVFPASRASLISGRSNLTPGLSTIVSAHSNNSGAWVPQRISRPPAASSPTAGPRSPVSLESVALTGIPLERRNLEVSTPVIPRPTTKNLFSPNFIRSPYLQT